MTVIDAEFAGHRFLVKVPLPDGTILRLLADTGGGYVIDPDRVGSLERVSLPDGVQGVRLPLDPPLLDGQDIARPYSPRFGSDGVVSAWWFAGHVWSFDYRAGRLSMLDTTLSTGVPLGFARSATGELSSPFPRITVTIDGEPIDLLLDTGASIELTDSAHVVLGDPRVRASSFIVASLFNRWREQHPDWRVLERASMIGNCPLIEVPSLEVGRSTVGPVWFEYRPDHSFHDWMSQWTDQRIDGALGATAFHDRELIIDYTTALATLD